MAGLDWGTKKVLVTGAGGFIASHLVEQLVQLGAQVRAFVRYNSRGDPGLLKLIPKAVFQEIEVIAGDLRDLPAVLAAVKGVSHVFHLGALIAIPYSYLHPAEVIETNIMGTLNVLQSARETGIERVIHTSTSEVYGTAMHVPINEQHPLQGQSPYSASKIGADKIVESFYLSYGLPVVTIRPFNTYGPRQSNRAVVPSIIIQALKGDVIYLGNVDARRDLTYISDTVNGFLQGGRINGIEGRTFNLGSGAEISIKDLVGEVIILLNKRVEIVVDPRRLRPEKSEVQRLLSDNHQAKVTLGWEPEVNLIKGLEKTITWIRNNTKHYQADVYQI